MYQRYRAKDAAPPVETGKQEGTAPVGPKPAPVPDSKTSPSPLSFFDSGDTLVLLILLLLLMEGRRESSCLILTLGIFLLLR